ncbi:M23 family metallopeptidase [Pontibacter vulgaris]|uniref:M23 family metallopeptidase n=1 Tax=Pontibacter vulgaris TaxID=2905679 RepID=UPI001FA7268A|nr:M23 family metallopeptidase [Pontibacter vulgaris]
MRDRHILLTLLLFVALSMKAQQKIVVSAKPDVILIEQVRGQQVCNFDFVIENKSQDSLQLDKLTMSVYDAKGQLLQQKFLDNNGTAPSIETIAVRQWSGAERHLLFNPFPPYPAALPVKTIKYEFVFSGPKGQETIVEKVVEPVAYKQKTALILPLKQRLLVYDGHDQLSHHRRFNYEFPPIKELGLASNFMRYAYDFVVVDAANKKYKSDGKADEDWYGYGAGVQAVAAGKVVAVRNDQPDNKKFDVPSLKTNALALYGNYVVVEHSKGELSMYGHLKQSSIPLKVGDNVQQGQQIGQIGVSGSSFFPHLHFEIRTSTDHAAEGLPSYFSNFYFLMGDKKEKVKRATVDTGDIIQSIK